MALLLIGSHHGQSTSEKSQLGPIPSEEHCGGEGASEKTRVERVDRWLHIPLGNVANSKKERFKSVEVCGTRSRD